MTGKIKVNDFAVVVSDKKMKGSGLSRGTVLYIASEKTEQIHMNDPYLLRTFVLGMKVVDGKVQIPNEKNDYLSYLVDPRNLERISGDQEKELYEALAGRN